MLSDVRAVYSVGPGFGPLEVELMLRGCEVGYSEPYVPFADELERRAEAAGVADRIIERHLDTFDRAPIAHRYDLVLAVHSWNSYVEDRAPLDRALGICAPGGRMVIVTPDLQSPLYEVFGVRRPQEVDVGRVSSWLRHEGLAHDVRRPLTTIARTVLADDDGQLTAAALGLATFLTARDRDDLGDTYLEHLRATIAAHPDGIDHVRGVIVIPATE